jgi:translation initiation factor 2 alpha subunit (eIF-2alpha)
MTDCYRMKVKPLPEVGEVVMARCLEVTENGDSYVALLEYGNKEAFLQKTELSAKYIKSLHKIIKPNKTFPVRVINVVKDNIDVSKKKILPSELNSADLEYERNKRVYQLVKSLALATEQTIESIYESMIWPLLQDYGHIDDAFTDISNDQYSNPCCSADLVTLVKKRYGQAPKTVSGKVLISCFGPEGIDAIKKVLKEQKQKYPNVSIVYITESTYLVSTTGAVRNLSEVISQVNKIMYEAISMIQKEVGGVGKLVQEAQASYQAKGASEIGPWNEKGSDDEDDLSSEYEDSEDDLNA